jgi:ABC-type nitrate/sulfonate/bicarbonate transport system permease component
VTGRRRRLQGHALGVVVLAAALVLWELWAGDSVLVPPPSEVLPRAWELWPTAEFRADVVESLRRLAAGLAVGATAGIAVGLLMGSSATVARTLDPLVELLRATPPIVLVPALIVLLDFGDRMQIALIAIGVCFPVLVNTVAGVRAVSPEARDTASMLHLGRVERVLRVYLPAALPSIAAGLRIALSLGLVLVVISEFVGHGGGLGAYIWESRGLYQYPEMYAAILFLGLLGYVLNRLFLVAERRLLAWHHATTSDPA